MPTLPPLWMEIRAHATHTRLLVRDAGLTLLTARVPPAPAHPRALPSLSEGLALWWNRSLHVVLDVDKVEVAIDGGAWRPAMIDPTYTAPYAWKLWTMDWPNPTAAEHSITSRAIDQRGDRQAAPTDPIIASKKTYWESFGWVTRREGCASRSSARSRDGRSPGPGPGT